MTDQSFIGHWQAVLSYEGVEKSCALQHKKAQTAAQAQLELIQTEQDLARL